MNIKAKLLIFGALAVLFLAIIAIPFSTVLAVTDTSLTQVKGTVLTIVSGDANNTFIGSYLIKTDDGRALSFRIMNETQFASDKNFYSFKNGDYLQIDYYPSTINEIKNGYDAVKVIWLNDKITASKNLPDLHLISLESYENENAKVGDTLHFFAKIINKGSVETGQYVVNKNGVYQNYLSLKPNSSSITYGLGFTVNEKYADYHGAGNYTYTLTIDPENKIQELDETNNSKTVNVYVSEKNAYKTSLSDLIITDASAYFEASSNKLKIKATVKNISGAPAVSSRTKSYKSFGIWTNINGVSGWANYVNLNSDGVVLKAGEVKDFYWDNDIAYLKSYKGLSFGKNTITITADRVYGDDSLHYLPNGYINESDETNNTYSLNFDYDDGSNGKLPDLVVSELVRIYTPSSWGNSSDYQVSYKVKNIGEYDVDPNDHFVKGEQIVVISPAGDVKYDKTWGKGFKIKAGGSMLVYGSVPKDKVQIGDTITITVDSANKISESSETNNTSSFKVIKEILTSDSDVVVIQPKEPVAVTPPEQSANQQDQSVSSKVYQPKSTTEAKKVLDNVKGKIVLQVEKRGEAYYTSPKTSKVYYLKDGESAYQIMRETGLGISEADFMDLMSSNSSGQELRKKLAGQIVLRVKARGEAYYIDPSNYSVTYMPDGNAAYQIMRQQGLGISNDNLSKVINIDK